MHLSLLLATILALLLPACAAPPAATQPATREIVVYAAASLRDAFNEIGNRFQQAAPNTRVSFNFAGSQQLAEQIKQGAPADVFASANARQMNDVIAFGRVTSGTQQVFAQNRLVVVVAQNAPAVQSLADLARPNTKIVLAARAVPAGQYALEFLSKASDKPEFGATFSQTVLANVVSYEEDVRAVFSKVALGEADAGVVYSSDVVAGKPNTIRAIAIPDDLNTLASYPIAPLNDSKNAALSKQFIDFVMSKDGQAILTQYGFVQVKQ
jgi:molybdate transport system substrate-binding protein